MSDNEIKKRVTECQEYIAYYNQNLALIRKSCPHVITFEGIYEISIGRNVNAEICSACGSCIKILNE